jgi:hypothetical protein
MKQYVGLSCDHSGSMCHVAETARLDYNQQVSDLKESAIRYGVDTIVSVVQCGILADVYPRNTVNRFSVLNSSISAVKPLSTYDANGRNTPLFDSVRMLIDLFKAVPDYNDQNVAFLITVTTDGQDNSSKITGSELGRMIRELEATDRWTFAFRVPNGSKQTLVKYGISEHNILEFDAGSNKEYAQASVVQSAATQTFYAARASGATSTKTFYANTDNLSQTEVRRELQNISKKVKVIRVAQEWAGKQIRDFIEAKEGSYVIGSVHYQLTKREEVQDNKRLILWDKSSGEYYTGIEARQMLGVPNSGTIKLVPGNFPQFELFVQSNSVNRKLVGSTKVVVYKG